VPLPCPILEIGCVLSSHTVKQLPVPGASLGKAAFWKTAAVRPRGGTVSCQEPQARFQLCAGGFVLTGTGMKCKNIVCLST